MSYFDPGRTVMCFAIGFIGAVSGLGFVGLCWLLAEYLQGQG